MVNEHVVAWKSPSNIALVKYWGKYGTQLPQNPSVSFTLSEATTTTKISLSAKQSTNEIELDFTFEGHKNIGFATRIEKFLTYLKTTHFPFLGEYSLFIESSNTFPHSSGIASSASGMSALALGLCSLEEMVQGKNADKDAFFQKASYISRLGSGSACRSLYPVMSVWGKNDSLPFASDEYGVGIADQVHELFHTFHDDILIVSAKEKSVSSTAGHHLMEKNPYAQVRYAQANNQLGTLLDALKRGDLDTFGSITEAEALTLHALMMASTPAFILMKEGSLKIIEKVKAFRAETKIPLYFTLDAGPNVHLLYPHACFKDVDHFIQSELLQHCANNTMIRDHVGLGPQRLL